MRLQPTLVFAGVLGLLSSPLAHAFTMENTVPDEPKFDLEEQMRQFRTGNGSGSSSGGTLYETPLGGGKLQFGVQQSPSYFGSSTFNSRATREDFNRVVTPENLR